jgi:hypothetical protein
MPTRPHGSPHLRNIPLAIRSVSQEVKDGPVMPHVKGPGGQSAVEDVGFVPRYLGRTRTQAGACLGQGRRRDVQDGYVFVAIVEQTVDEGRCSGPNVDDRS